MHKINYKVKTLQILFTTKAENGMVSDYHKISVSFIDHITCKTG